LRRTISRRFCQSVNRDPPAARAARAKAAASLEGGRHRQTLREGPAEGAGAAGQRAPGSPGLPSARLSAGGMSAADIGAVLHYSPHTVRRWIARHHLEGISGLPDRPRSGRPRLGSTRLGEAAVHLGLAPPEPTCGHESGQPDATRDRHHADASTDRFDRLVEAHSFSPSMPRPATGSRCIWASWRARCCSSAAWLPCVAAWVLARRSRRRGHGWPPRRRSPQRPPTGSFRSLTASR
jgi:hypothetical protein